MTEIDTPLKRWRREHDATLQETSDLTGYSISFLSRIECSERHPSPKAKLQIARRLGVRVAELFPLDGRSAGDHHELALGSCEAA